MYQSVEKKISKQWWETNFPCREACPVHTEAGRYVSLIAEGRYEDAYRVARRPNPFASVCGRICAAPCEKACTRGKIDTPIAIRALKRFVCERYGVESMIDLDSIRATFGDQLRSTGKWIAVVGGGPAGLSAAHDLALLGHQVSLFEAHGVLGGMLTLGIPEYRLPRELIRMEINAILSLGIDVHLNKKLGRDFSLEDLRENGYHAIFLGIGALRSKQLNIEGIQADGVIQALDFLININCGYRVGMGKKILIVGGGSVAFDAARTAVRQVGKEELRVSDIVSALDAARSAIRFGAEKVEVVCLESSREMPADPDEIEDAEREGITIHYSRGPKRIIAPNGRVEGIEVLTVETVFDSQGRFDPTFLPQSEEILEADTIIVAIGQQPDLSFINPSDCFTIGRNQTIAVDFNTLASSVPGIWAGGDVAFGPRNVIHAIADGKRAAFSIHNYLKGTQRKSQKKDHIYVPDIASYRPRKNFDSTSFQHPPKLPLNRRTGIAQVELAFAEDQAVPESSRCLRCWINTIFEGNPIENTECILCGGCADVCPENCIDIIPMRNVAFEPDLNQKFNSNEDVPEYGEFQKDLDQLQGAAIIKDETRCLRCGLCARRCPVQCITMEAIFFRETE